MSINLEPGEIEVVRALQNTGVSLQEATLAVIMFTRGLARPERELADIIGLYPGLEDGHLAQHTITTLVNKGWLVTTESYGQRITRVAPDLPDKIEQLIHNTTLVDRLSAQRSHSARESHIRILGSMTTEYVFGSYLDLMRSAQREICLPMLATSPNLTAVAILQERARRGVQVRILLATPEVAVKLRGGPVASKAREAIEGWTRNARDIPKMEIRIVHHLEDMHFATSWTLDRRLLRFDIYDPFRQRSLEGVMIEVESPAGFDLNMVTLFQARFDAAWNRAQPIDAYGKVRWWVTSNWQWLAFGVTALIALAFGPSVWGGIAGSLLQTLRLMIRVMEKQIAEFAEPEQMQGFSKAVCRQLCHFGCRSL